MQPAAVVAVAIALVAASEASALTLKNTDTDPQGVTVTEAGKERQLKLAPGDSSTLCPKGCALKLDNGEEYEFEGTESVSIEDGVIYIDEGDGGEESEPPPAEEYQFSS